MYDIYATSDCQENLRFCKERRYNLRDEQDRLSMHHSHFEFAIDSLREPKFITSAVRI